MSENVNINWFVIDYEFICVRIWYIWFWISRLLLVIRHEHALETMREIELSYPFRCFLWKFWTGAALAILTHPFLAQVSMLDRKNRWRFSIRKGHLRQAGKQSYAAKKIIVVHFFWSTAVENTHNFSWKTLKVKSCLMQDTRHSAFHPIFSSFGPKKRFLLVKKERKRSSTALAFSLLEVNGGSCEKRDKWLFFSHYFLTPFESPRIIVELINLAKLEVCLEN